MSLRDRRVQYETAGLDRGDLRDDPLAQFTVWYDDAAAAGVAEPNAFTLSTTDATGRSNARVVLARGADSAESSSIPTTRVPRVGNLLRHRVLLGRSPGWTCTGKCASVVKCND